MLRVLASGALLSASLGPSEPIMPGTRVVSVVCGIAMR
jgi:hypothetical protein